MYAVVAASVGGRRVVEFDTNTVETKVQQPISNALCRVVVMEVAYYCLNGFCNLVKTCIEQVVVLQVCLLLQTCHFWCVSPYFISRATNSKISLAMKFIYFFKWMRFVADLNIIGGNLPVFQGTASSCGLDSMPLASAPLFVDLKAR